MSAATLAELQQHRYEISSNDFLRFREDPLDDAIARIVASVAEGDEDERASVRNELTSDDVDTLLTFAQRRVVRAHRSADGAAARAALDALAVIPPAGYDFYEPWCKAAYFLAARDGDLDDLGERFCELADPRLVDRASITLDAMNRVHSLAQCGLVEVSTSYGPGLLFVATPLSSSSDPFGGVRGRPSIVGDFPEAYAPRTNLAQVAVSLADALETTGLTTCSPLEHDELSATLFSDVIDGGFLPVRGCLSWVAEEVATGASFTIYVAEVPDDEDVDALVDAVLLNDDQAAAAEGTRLVILSAVPDFEVDFADDDVDLDNFDENDEEFDEDNDEEDTEDQEEEPTPGEVRFAAVLALAFRVLEETAAH